MSCKAVVGYQQPDPPYSNDLLLDALTQASVSTRGYAPTGDEVRLVCMDGLPAYLQLIDKYTDSTQTPELVGQLRTYWLNVFELGDQVVNGVNNAEPANLTAYVLENDLPFTEILTATYCVDDNAQQVACSGGSPFPSGILTNQAALRGYAGAVGNRRASVFTQLAQCAIIPNPPRDRPLNACNNCSGAPSSVLPVDDPPDPPRIHKKYQTFENPGECFACHGLLSARRLVFAKYDTDGVFDNARTILDMETPLQNSGECYTVPTGFTEPGTGGNELTPCCADFNNPATCLSTLDAILEPGGCCWHPTRSDFHSYGAIECTNAIDECNGLFFDNTMNKPGDWGKLLREIEDAGFAQCVARRLYAFARDDDPGEIGMGESAGTVPAMQPQEVLDDYANLLVETNNWNGRLLIRDMYKSDHYLGSFQSNSNCAQLLTSSGVDLGNPQPVAH